MRLPFCGYCTRLPGGSILGAQLYMVFESALISQLTVHNIMHTVLVRQREKRLIIKALEILIALP